MCVEYSTFCANIVERRFYSFPRVSQTRVFHMRELEILLTLLEPMVKGQGVRLCRSDMPVEPLLSVAKAELPAGDFKEGLEAVNPLDFEVLVPVNVKDIVILHWGGEYFLVFDAKNYPPSPLTIVGQWRDVKV